MSGKIQRSDQREQEYDRYADALRSRDESGSTADMFGNGRPVAYQRADSALLPAMTSGLLNLSEISGRRRDDADLGRPKFKLASDLGRDMSDEMMRRAMNRRAMAGLPLPERAIVGMDVTEGRTDTVDDIDADDVLSSIDALLPTIARRSGGQMNRTAQKTAIDLIKMLRLSGDQTEWFIARIEGGITNPEVFRRDLRMAFSSEEVL